MQKFGMEDAKPVHPPVETSTKLTIVMEDYDGIDQKLYQSVVRDFM